MFNLARVFRRDFRINAQPFQPGREERVPFIDQIRNFLSGWSEGDIAFRRDDDISVFP